MKYLSNKYYNPFPKTPFAYEVMVGGLVGFML